MDSSTNLPPRSTSTLSSPAAGDVACSSDDGAAAMVAEVGEEDAGEETVSIMSESFLSVACEAFLDGADSGSTRVDEEEAAAAAEEECFLGTSLSLSLVLLVLRCCDAFRD